MVIEHKKTKIKSGIEEKIFVAICYVVVTVLAVTMIYPLINVLAVSMSSESSYLDRPWMIFPTELAFEGYEYLLNYAGFWRSYLNTLIVVGVGTAGGLLITILMAYPLSRPQLKCKPLFMTLVIFTMVFSAGMIPGYLNMKELHLLDTYWAMIAPYAFTGYNCILMISFFRGIPNELIEAAEIEGASEPYILFKIVVPLSKAVIASITLFMAVGYWNNYFAAQIYVKSREMWPIALILKEILTEYSKVAADATLDPAAMEKFKSISMTAIQNASIIVSTLPILAIYPFLQKHFAKGVMVGGVKG